MMTVINEIDFGHVMGERKSDEVIVMQVIAIFKR